MKFSIKWHKNGQKNFRKGIDDNIHKCEEWKEKIKNQEKEYSFKQRQIEEAEKQGKDGFDGERFLIKRESTQNKGDVGK